MNCDYCGGPWNPDGAQKCRGCAGPAPKKGVMLYGGSLAIEAPPGPMALSGGPAVQLRSFFYNQFTKTAWR